MSKCIDVTVSTSLSTDFYFEISDKEYTELEIKELVHKNIEKELNSQMEKWNIDELEVIINT